jgi:hypothetical protein
MDRKSNSYHPTSSVRATAEARSLVSPQRPNADDGVLENISPNPHTSSFNSSSFNSPTTFSSLERALDQPPLPFTAFLEDLEREQLQEIHAKGGFAGFTAQEIEGWVAADRA